MDIRPVPLDLRLALRGLLARPGFAAGAILTLAIGIGANAAMFSVVYGVLFRPLPFPDPGRLVVAWETNASRGFDRMNASPPSVEDWRAATAQFEDIGAYTTGSDVLPGADGGALVRLGRLTAPLLDTLGVRPLFGRVFTDADGAAGATPVIVLTESLWRTRFGADPGIVGRSIAFEGGRYDVVGVTPAGFSFPPPVAFEAIKTPRPVDAFVVLRRDQQAGRGAHYLTAIGRLKPGVSVAAAQEALQGIARQSAADHPETNTGWSVTLVPLAENIVGGSRTALLVLFGAVALVLLLACANTAHLLLARALDRRREIAVRVALGASTRRLARQLLTEGLVLAALGAGAGLLLASWIVRVLVATAPDRLPRVADIRLDGATLAATAVAAIVAAVLASLAPMAQALRRSAVGHLRDRTGSHGAGRTRGLLIVGEAAMAVMLVAVSVLMTQSLLRLSGIDPGFRPDDLLTFHVRRTAPPGEAAGGRTAFLENALARLRAIPGVEQVATIDAAPLTDDRQGTSFSLDGAPPFPAGQEPAINFSFVSPGYFETLGIRLVEGRTFTPADRAGSAPVVIVNETFARQYLAGGDPIGRRIAVGYEDDLYRTVVGVVGDERHESLDGALRGGVYTPVYQYPWPSYAFFVRGGPDPAALVPVVRQTLAAIDPGLAVYDARPMASVMAESLGTARFSARLMAAFAGTALLLALVGVYGIASHSVAARRSELGVRIALGARPGAIRRVVVLPALRLAVAGAGLGLAGTAVASRVLASLLHDVSPLAPTAYLTAAAAVIGATLLATWLPARRAARTDPVRAMGGH
ncbi:MAG: ABC transporter permease [Vicinamibacterales bacterium]